MDIKTNGDQSLADLLEGLKMSLPPKIPYGELVCAEGGYGNAGPLVYEDPEPYFIEDAINFIDKQFGISEQFKPQKKLWQFKWDSNDSLIIGLFKATDEEVAELIGKEIYLGEVSGKHSEVYGTVEDGEITLVSDIPVVIDSIPEIGYNPIGYVSA